MFAQPSSRGGILENPSRSRPCFLSSVCRRSRGRRHVDAAADPAARRAPQGDGLPRRSAGFRRSHGPMGAIVSLGGCSASFVSPDGLIVTNHHCVQGALQFNSTPQKNLMEDGFLATAREQELTAGPGSRVYVTTSVVEVTDEIAGKVDPKLGDRARYEVIEKRIKERTAACEKDGQRCRVASFFDGLKSTSSRRRRSR